MEFIIYDRVPKSFVSFDFEADTRSPIVALAMFTHEHHRQIASINCFYSKTSQAKPYGEYLIVATCGDDLLMCSNWKPSRVEQSYLFLEKLI